MLELIAPKISPPLDPEFRPAALANRAYRARLGRQGVPLVVVLERENGYLSRFETQVFPDNHPKALENLFYAERLFKFLLWQRGGYKAYIGGSTAIANHIRKIYSANGKRKFDIEFMSALYEQPFTIAICEPNEVPPAQEMGSLLGRHLDGYRIGFDLGASDRKVSAVVDGQVIYSEEVAWEPRVHSDPNYHYREIMAAIRSAASKMPRVDAIGGSAAGIYIENQPRYASLFRSIPPERYKEVRSLFLRISAEMGLPLDVINDGDVTALAGAMSFDDNGVLGIAMGSSEAAGYIDLNNRILGWLNELASAPIDYAPNAPTDELSGGTGAGSQYFSQQCVFRLTGRARIQSPEDLTDAEKLKFVQEKLEAGHAGAIKIWQTMGVYLGYGLAHYADYYDIKHALILGRCTSGCGGDLILAGAKHVLEREFPELATRIQVQMPDEMSRRVGQSIAAASLPEIIR